MRTIQPDLINFSEFQALNLFDGKILISRTGIIHTKRETCPSCGCLCSYNGSSNKGKHVLSNSCGVFLRKGQQCCPNCGVSIQVDNEWLDEAIESFNKFIVSQVLSLSTNLSEDEIVKHLENTMSIKISKSTVHNIIKKSNEKFEDIEFDYEVKDHFYGYDEQYLKINGKRAYRLVFFDIKENKIIYEKIHYNFSKKILKQILIEVFGDAKPKGFVVDMRVEYPDAFKQVFGRSIKLQFCVFHLNKLILKEYGDSLKTCKVMNWTLMDYYNMYCLFNVFYNRNFELKILKRFMSAFEKFKKDLTRAKVKFYVEKYKLKLKTFENQKEKVIEIIEKKLMKAFRKILHDKKNLRKRRGETLKVRTLESAKKTFANVHLQKGIFPKKIQKRIERIKENFEYFIASEGEVLTNNKLEGFFGATLKKFRKKIRRSIVSLSATLKRKRAEQEGISYFRKFTIFDLAKIFTVLKFFS